MSKLKQTGQRRALQEQQVIKVIGRKAELPPNNDGLIVYINVHAI